MIAHEFGFDPRYGYGLEELLKVGAPEGPGDFAEFWQGVYVETMGVRPRVERREIKSGRSEVRVFEVEFDSLEGFRVGGWLTEPVEGKVTELVVCGHGYGGRDGVDWELSGGAGRAVVYPCGRGFNRSARGELPGDSTRHVRYGIGSRETYIHKGCVADIWAAGTVLVEMFPEGAGRLFYRGSSFGGGMGALALPWDGRFRRGYLGIPSFGNHPLRVTLECVGSGESVRGYFARHPEVLGVLAYFDAATAARFNRVPTLVAAAKFDPAVPPPGQFAVYNALAGERELFVREVAHFADPLEAEDDRRLGPVVEAWFARD